MPDGSVKYVHAVAHAVRDASGNIEFGVQLLTLRPQRKRNGSCDAAMLFGRIGAFASYKQLGLGRAASRVGISVARNIRPVWIRSGTGRCAAASVPGSHSSEDRRPNVEAAARAIREKADFEVDFELFSRTVRSSTYIPSGTPSSAVTAMWLS